MKWMLGLSALILTLMGAVVFSTITAANAAAYNGNGPGGRWAQTTPGTAQPGSGWWANGGGQRGAGLGMGMMNGYGRGGGMGGPGVNTPIATGPLSNETTQFLTQAIQNEYRARALYQAVIDKFGQVLPFANIVRTESMHVAALNRLFTNHGLSVPVDTFAGKVEAPATLAEAFGLAIQTETDNAAMYDGFLKTVKEADVARVFTRLGTASSDMHLKAFEYYSK
jgi:rubrerythrin